MIYRIELHQPMPYTYTATYQVRYYECDANGHMNNAQYLRLMQETAAEAVSSAGFGHDYLQSIGKMWLAHETAITYEQPLYYGDEIVVKTWISDIRRSSSRRIYEFWKTGENMRMAQAYTDWIYMDIETRRPAIIPGDIISFFYPEGVPESFTKREKFPEPPVPPPGAFKYQARVAWRDLDVMQHVNNAVYLEYTGECGARHVAHVGWPWEKMVEEGFAIFLRKNWIQYHLPATWDDEIEITTWLTNVRRSTAERFYDIRRTQDTQLLARVLAVGVCVDVKQGLPIRFPVNFMQSMAGSVV